MGDGVCMAKELYLAFPALYPMSFRLFSMDQERWERQIGIRFESCIQRCAIQRLDLPHMFFFRIAWDS